MALPFCVVNWKPRYRSSVVGPVPLHWMEQDSNNLKITASPSLTMYLSLSNPGTAPVNDHEHTKIVRIVVYKGNFMHVHAHT